MRLRSRNEVDLTAGFPDVATAVAALPGGDLVLDGELVIFDNKGVSRFQLLQRRGAGGRSEYAVFDLLERDGASLLKRPLKERRAALEGLIADRGLLRLSRRLGKNGAKALETARSKQWEGIIAKDETSIYEPGVRTRSWLKVKVRKQSEFVIGGFTAPAGSRAHLGACSSASTTAPCCATPARSAAGTPATRSRSSRRCSRRCVPIAQRSPMLRG